MALRNIVLNALEIAAFHVNSQEYINLAYGLMDGGSLFHPSNVQLIVAALDTASTVLATQGLPIREYLQALRAYQG